MGYYDNEGIVKLTNFKRLSARVNTSYNFFDGKLKNRGKFYLQQNQRTDGSGVLDPALRALPIIPVHTVDGIGWRRSGWRDERPSESVRLLEYNKDNGYRYQRFFGNVYAELQPVKNLTLKSSFGVDFSNYYKRMSQRSYVSGYLKMTKNAVNIDQSDTEKWTWTNIAQYTPKLEITTSICWAEWKCTRYLQQYFGSEKKVSDRNARLYVS